MCVCARSLTFQSMVEKKAWRLISSTPSDPAPKDTDHSGSLNLARSLLLFSQDQHIHTFLSLSGFQHVI